ncbi:uncharacterized protein G2W53_001732 [Senna tora]|uniref:Uncharacterized protein n=1 Tax=Senna tora TaxID=362788 RepID=A0A834XGU3_9FABA|nr:uncharacterized protein G2W53_001732 [Senna tora]
MGIEVLGRSSATVELNRGYWQLPYR